MKSFKQHLSEDNVATLKKIVSNKQNMPLKMKDGSMKVDLFTASAFMKGMEKINPTNKKKVMDMINNGTKAQFLQLQNVFMKADDEDPSDDDSQKLQAMDQEKLDELLEMSEEAFDKHLDTLSDEDFLQLEGVLGAIGRGVKAVGRAAVGGVKKVANRLSTSGRADAAQAKLAKMQKKKADRDRLAKAKADMAAMKAREREQKAAKRDQENKRAEQEREKAKQERERAAQQKEGYDAKDDHNMDPRSHVVKEKDKFAVYNIQNKKVKEFDNKKDAEDYSIKNHDALMKKEETKMKKESIYDASLRVLLGEDGYSQNPAFDGTDSAMHDISKDDIVKQLNAFVGAIGMREYVNPKGALLQLQGKLATIGIAFEVPEMPGEKGKVVAELTQYGGRYGKDTDTPHDEIINDDGIAHRGIERKLEIEYETVRHGCSRVYAKIV
tara:strand:+ start:3534 stop:4850 length:1317 start_codon:yes stop_codon:yes gene_type:complete